MSFERFEPARAEELQSSESVPADGKKVGGDKSLDTLDSTGDGKKPEKRIPTIEETGATQEVGKGSLVDFVKNNPGVLSTQDKGPEAVKQAGLEVKEKWPL